MSQTDSSTPAGGSYVCHLDDLEAVDEFCRARATILLSIVHSLVPRCQKFFPIYEEVAATLSISGSELECAQIQAGGTPGLGSRFGVRAYPTVILCHGSQNFKTYHGPLKKDDILAFLRRQDMPAITNIESSAALHDFRKTHNTVVVAYMSPEDRAVREGFAAAAEEMKDDFCFCILNNRSAADQGGISMPSVVVYKNVAEERSVLRSSPSAEAIRYFVKAAAKPLIMELLPELHEKMLQQSVLPLGYIFVSSPSQQQQTNIDFLSIARRYRGDVQFHSVDVNEFPDLAENMHLESVRWPAFAIHEPSRNHKYPLNDGDDPRPSLGPKEVGLFVESFLTGKLRPTIKSQPIPSVQAGPVVEVVGLSYEDVVLDPNRDVLVEFYTPWCAPCKALLPAYEQLASLYASDDRARDLVAIAKLDYEANDVPDIDVRGVPWFKLYPAGRKESPVTYAGERRVADWARFITEKGAHGLDLALHGDSP